MDRTITKEINKIFDAISLTSGSSATGSSAFSRVIDMRSSSDYVLMQHKTAGNGTIRVEAHHSLDNVTYNRLCAASTYLWDGIVSGDAMSPVKNLQMSVFVKLKAKNTATTSAITSFELWMATK
jgi:hypothetical protein